MFIQSTQLKEMCSEKKGPKTRSDHMDLCDIHKNMQSFVCKLCAGVCVCVCVCMRAHTHVSMYVCMHVCTHRFLSVHEEMKEYLCMVNITGITTTMADKHQTDLF